MGWELTEDVEEFRAAAGAFLAARPVRHTMPLTIVETLRRRGGTAYGKAPPLFGWWRSPGGAVEAAFVETPPRPVVVVASAPELVESLARAPVRADRPISGVNAEVEPARVFAAAWQELSGVGSEVAMRTRLHHLAELVPPVPMPAGAARPAGPGDRDLLVAWQAQYNRDIGSLPTDQGAAIDDWIGYGGLMLWCVDDVPASMAGCTPSVAGMARIAPVFTPYELRGRGYAAAVTAAMSKAAKARGAEEVVLLTDLVNPTSNALYRRLGYRPVHDRLVLAFMPRA